MYYGQWVVNKREMLKLRYVPSRQNGKVSNTASYYGYSYMCLRTVGTIS